MDQHIYDNVLLMCGHPGIKPRVMLYLTLEQKKPTSYVGISIFGILDDSEGYQILTAWHHCAYLKKISISDLTQFMF